MFDELDKYKSTDHFFYSKDNELKSVCNAPNGVGVFIVYALKDGKIELIYIGSSGKTVENNGIADKMVNAAPARRTGRTIWRATKQKLERKNYR